MQIFGKKTKFLNAKYILPFFCFAVLFFIIPFAFSFCQAETKEQLSVVSENNKEYSDEYKKFLSLSEAERENCQVIPRMYDIDFETLYTSAAYQSILEGDSLPIEYSLFNVSGIINNFSTSNKNNYSFESTMTNVGNQYLTGICWCFAINTALETTIYKTISSSTKLNFSELNIAYTSQVALRGNSSISGGTFDLAYEYLTAGYGPVYEQVGEAYSYSTANDWSSNANATSFYRNSFLSTAQSYLSNYCVCEAFCYPSKASCNGDSTKELALRNSIKTHISQYGGVTASIYMNSSSYMNSSGAYCYTGTLSSNHMICLVGWDDNVSFIINGVRYTGAYIAQNSYGTSGQATGYGGFFYVMYADSLVETNVNGFVRVEEKTESGAVYNNLSGTASENRFVTFISGQGSTMSLKQVSGGSFYYANVYKRANIDNQYISGIRVPTVIYTNETNFYVYVLDNLSISDVSTQSALTNSLKTKYSSANPISNANADESDEYMFTSNQSTYYKLKTEDSLYVEGDYFAIIVKVTSGEIWSGNNNTGELSAPYQFSYCSMNPSSSWDLYYHNETQNQKCILPMIVETRYDVGTISYTKEGYSGVYDGKSHHINVSVSEPSAYQISYTLNDDYSSLQNSNISKKDVGDYTIYFKIVSAYYETVYDSATIEISKKTVTVTPIADSKTYGSNDPILGMNYEGAIETPSFSGQLTRTSGENVGNYLINLGSLALKSSSTFNSDNYELKLSTATVCFSITKKDLIVTPNAISKIYGESDPETIGYAFQGNVSTESPIFIGQLSRETGENAGLYNINIGSLSLGSNTLCTPNFLSSNYNLKLSEGHKFEIEKRDLIIKPTPPEKGYTKQFNEDDPSFLYEVLNCLDGELYSLSGNIGRESGENAGYYALNLGTLSMNSTETFNKDNYELKIHETAVYLHILCGKLIDYCSLNGLIVNYSGNYYSLTPITTGLDGISFSYSVDGSYFRAQNYFFKNVSSDPYNIYVKFSKTNYEDFIKFATIKINPIDLTVTPSENQSKAYSLDDPETYLFSYSGNVSGDTPCFSGNLGREVDDNYTTYEDVGEYLFNAGTLALEDGTNFLKQNYNLIFNSAAQVKFKILKKDITLFAKENQFKIYGEGDPELEYYFGGVAEGQTAACSGNLIRDIDEDHAVEYVGQYQIRRGSISLANYPAKDFAISNYNLVFSTIPVYFEIKKADITLIVCDKEIKYTDEIDNDFECEITGNYIENDELDIEYQCSVTDKSKKGIYPISATANNDNYNITIVNGEYKITYYFYDIKFEFLGVIKNTVSIEHFGKVSKNDIPVVSEEGYTFNYWKIVNADTSYVIVPNPENLVITGETTFIADAILNTYRVNYNLNNGVLERDETTFTVLSEDVELEIPTRKGYSFKGWFDNILLEGEGVEVIPQGSCGNKTFYAKWEINKYTISLPNNENDKFELSYDKSPVVEYNKSFSFAVELKEAYNQSQDTFKVFKINSQSEKTELNLDHGKYILRNIDDNFTISFEGILINTYEVKFMADDNVVLTLLKDYGSNLVIGEYPAIPMANKENYSDSPAYWNLDHVDDIKEDVIIRAVYIPNVYQVTFVLEDGTQYTTEVTYGEDVNEQVLKDNVDIGLFDYFVYDSSLQNIDSSRTINVKVGSNIYIFYIVLAIFVSMISCIIVVRIVKKKKRSKLSWWAYTKGK